MASFDQRFGPWFGMRESPNVEDRTNEPWPWHSLSPRDPSMTPTSEEVGMQMLDGMAKMAPQTLTPLGRAAGLTDIKYPSEDELIRFLIAVDSHNAKPEGK